MIELKTDLTCPHCGDAFTFSFPNRRGKGLRRNHTWQMCPKCNQPVEVTVSYSEKEYEIKIEKAA